MMISPLAMHKENKQTHKFQVACAFKYKQQNYKVSRYECKRMYSLSWNQERFHKEREKLNLKEKFDRIYYIKRHC